MTTILNFILTLNLLLTVLWIFSFLKINPRLKLKLQYLGLGLTLFAALVQPLLPGNEFMSSHLDVWSAGTSEVWTSAGITEPRQDFMTLSPAHPEASVSVTMFSILTGVLTGLMLLTGLIFIFREISLLQKIKRASYLFRKFGTVQLRLSDATSSSFSYWLPGTYYCVFPSSILLNQKDLEVSLNHELQHHRQGDTLMAPLILFIKFFFFYNPLTHLWIRNLHELQEFACDEAVLQNKKINVTDYIGCLIRAAETMVSSESVPVCAAGLIFDRKPNILKRRILMMKEHKRPAARLSLVVMIAMLTGVMGWTAYASRGMVKDRRISMADGLQMAEKANEKSEIKLPLNEEVLDQLNHFLGTPEGREYFKTSLQRKATFATHLQDAVEKYGTPDDLNAIPIIESGYQNVLSQSSAKSGGLWMFIPSTAKKFGMKINAGIDERLNVHKETMAAHRYLLSNKKLFNDWMLGIFAYNVGEGAVKQGIKKYGTTDVWELSKYIRGDKDYMARVVAAMIIMRNPEILER